MSLEDPDPRFVAGVVLIAFALAGGWTFHQRDTVRADMQAHGAPVEARVVRKGETPVNRRRGRVDVEIPGPAPTVVPIWLPNEQWHAQPPSGTIRVRWLATRPDATETEHAFQAGRSTDTTDLAVVTTFALVGALALTWSFVRPRAT